jgi:hypothetical protein
MVALFGGRAVPRFENRMAGWTNRTGGRGQGRPWGSKDGQKNFMGIRCGNHNQGEVENKTKTIRGGGANRRGRFRYGSNSQRYPATPPSPWSVGTMEGKKKTNMKMYCCRRDDFQEWQRDLSLKRKPHWEWYAFDTTEMAKRRQYFFKVRVLPILVWTANLPQKGPYWEWLFFDIVQRAYLCVDTKSKCQHDNGVFRQKQSHIEPGLLLISKTTLCTAHRHIG